MKPFSEGLILIYLMCYFQPCTGEAQMILIKFHRVATHYKNYMRNDYTFDSDPLKNAFSSTESKKMLCNTLRSAKQFAYPDSPRSEDQTEFWTNNLTNQDDSSSQDLSLMKLENKRCTVRLAQSSIARRQVECLQCVKTKKVEWFIAFGGIDGLMYLLEPGTFKGNLDYRLTGILEPSAEIDNRTFLYFYTQFEQVKVKTRSICSYSSKGDKLRLCSSVLNATDKKEILSVNYLQERRKCPRAFVKGRSLFELASVLPCSFYNPEGTLLKEFFLLLDSRLDGAVFVLYDTGRMKKRIPILEVQKRVIGVGALLNPIGKMKRTTSKIKRSSGKTGLSKRKRKRNLQVPPEDTHTSDDDPQISNEESNERSTGTRKYRHGKSPIDSEEKDFIEIPDLPGSPPVSDEENTWTWGRGRRQGKKPQIAEESAEEESENEISARESESDGSVESIRKKNSEDSSEEESTSNTSR